MARSIVSEEEKGIQLAGFPWIIYSIRNLDPFKGDKIGQFLWKDNEIDTRSGEQGVYQKQRTDTSEINETYNKHIMLRILPNLAN